MRSAFNTGGWERGAGGRIGSLGGGGGRYYTCIFMWGWKLKGLVYDPTMPWPGGGGRFPLKRVFKVQSHATSTIGNGDIDRRRELYSLPVHYTYCTVHNITGGLWWQGWGRQVDERFSLLEYYNFTVGWPSPGSPVLPEGLWVGGWRWYSFAGEGNVREFN
jgi:hypothetical protein